MLNNRKLCVLMCCSDIRTVKGGMVTITKNYLNCEHWKSCEFIFIPTHRDGGKLIKVLFFLRAYIKIFFLLLRRTVNIAHLHMSERGSFYRKDHVARLCHFFSIPVIFHHHGAEFEDFYHALPAGKKNHVRKVLETAELNLVLSVCLARLYQDKAPNAKIEVLYNAVNVPDTNSYSAHCTTILLLGRLGKRKGTYDFLKALKLAAKELPPGTQCYLCGDGDIQQVKGLVSKWGLEHLIAYIGWADDKMKEQLFKASGVHILPSYSEGLPMSILETMAHGIPNISTDIASIPEVIEDGRNGFLIRPGDVMALKEKMVILLKNQELKEQFSVNSYVMIKEKFSSVQMVKRLENCYWTLAKKESFRTRK